MAVEQLRRSQWDSLPEDVPDSDTFDDATVSQPLVCDQSARPLSWQANRGCRVVVGIMTALALLAVVVLCALQPGLALRVRLQKGVVQQKQEITMLDANGASESGDGQCTRIEEDTDYPGNDIDEIHDVTSADGCCRRCTSNPECIAWAWGKARDQDFSDVCYLKGGPSPSVLESVERGGYIAGQRVQPNSAVTPVQTPHSPLSALTGFVSGLLHTETDSQEPLPSQPPVTASFLPPKQPSWAVCPLLEDGTEYPGNDLRVIENVLSHEECCEECSKEQDCVAYSWGRARNVDVSDKCFLKGGRPRPYLTKVKNDDMTSGKVKDSSIELIQRPAGTLMYCFSLMLPGTVEKDLIQFQYDKGTSIFDCDAYDVYSSEIVDAAPQVPTIKVDTSLECEKGGEFGTALNKDIFMVVWARVLSLGRWSRYDWTVKVDPDAPFFPTRLRYMVAVHPEGPGGVYLNNCIRGLHGPIEVFSKSAVGAWEAGRDQCEAYFQQVCHGDCKWGEDMFIDQCLSKVLNVRRDFEPNLLVEDHCDPPPDYRSCANRAMASYHPFKTVGEYEACYSVQPPESI